MNTRYHHTQIGKVTIGVFIVSLSILLGTILTLGYNSNMFTGILILLISLGLFATLTVKMTDTELLVWFGPGFIRKKFALNTITACRAVKNPWYYGWGIRLTPHGWMYNVSGFQAVEITLTSGKKFRIGTDEPDKLVQTMNQYIIMK